MLPPARIRRYFNPRSPRGGATGAHAIGVAGIAHFNPRSPRGGATLCIRCFSASPQYFNPRSPRGGATTTARRAKQRSTNFNPRSPRGGATIAFAPSYTLFEFQSTLPTRGSDRLEMYLCLMSTYFNPRSPRGGATFQRYPLIQPQPAISIHAPHEGERQHTPANYPTAHTFQSTLPTRGSDPRRKREAYAGRIISIHAPHEGERPSILGAIVLIAQDFNPRSPRGGATRAGHGGSKSMGKFQSTLPTRGSDKMPVRSFCNT